MLSLLCKGSTGVWGAAALLRSALRVVRAGFAAVMRVLRGAVLTSANPCERFDGPDRFDWLERLPAFGWLVGLHFVMLLLLVVCRSKCRIC